MKHILSSVLALLVLATMTYAQLPVMANKAHDFRPSTTRTVPTGGTETTLAKGASEKLCAYCHTPHVPSTGIKAPLWSRAKYNGSTLATYNNTISSTMNASPTAIASGDDNISSMCMSCHDGSSDIFATTLYVKKPHNTSGSWTPQASWSSANLNGGKYGAGLSHTHPVNFDYAAAAALDAGLETAPKSTTNQASPAVTSAAPPLYNGMVQCGSCHNPHLSSKMTRISTDHGQLCIACHKK